jgi:hypothetical protein
MPDFYLKANYISRIKEDFLWALLLFASDNRLIITRSLRNTHTHTGRWKKERKIGRTEGAKRTKKSKRRNKGYTPQGSTPVPATSCTASLVCDYFRPLIYQIKGSENGLMKKVLNNKNKKYNQSLEDIGATLPVNVLSVMAGNDCDLKFCTSADGSASTLPSIGKLID